MSENTTGRSELREALAWLTSAAILVYLPSHLREWFRFSPPLVVAVSLWLAAFVFLAIDERSKRSKMRNLLFATTICVVIYAAGLMFKFAP